MISSQSSIMRLVIIFTCVIPLAGCKQTSNVDRSEHNSEDQKVDPTRTKTANIYAHASRVPYEIIVDVYGEIGGHEGSHEIVTSKNKAYTQMLKYTSGRRIQIRVEVKPPRYGSGAFCSITDGSHINKIGPVDDSWRAICELTTAY